jgi:hypothetical protein
MIRAELLRRLREESALGRLLGAPARSTPIAASA